MVRPAGSEFQLTPSGDTSAVLWSPTATKRLPLHLMLYSEPVVGDFSTFHEIPSAELTMVPPLPTATYLLPDQATSLTGQFLIDVGRLRWCIDVCLRARVAVARSCVLRAARQHDTAFASPGFWLF